MLKLRWLVAALVAAIGAVLLVAPPAGAASPPGQLSPGEELLSGQTLRSLHNTFALEVNNYGQLFVDGPIGFVWDSSTAGGRLIMQPDGNLVNYDPSTGRAVWATGTGVPGSFAVMQDDGNLVVYSPSGRAQWASASDRPVGGDYRDRLLPDAQMRPNYSLTSENGAYRAVMQSDGNFVVYGASGPVWASGTGGGGNTFVYMQPDGNLVIYSSTVPTPRAAFQPMWHTATGNRSGTILVLQDDGALVVYRFDGTPLWSSKNSPGTQVVNNVLRAGGRLVGDHALYSADYRYRAIMQMDGNFVVYGPNGPVWASRTGEGYASILMTSGGDAVITGSTYENALWHSGTAGNSGAVLVLQNDGNLVVYRANGTAAWASLPEGAWKPGSLPLFSPRYGWW